METDQQQASRRRYQQPLRSPGKLTPVLQGWQKIPKKSETRWKSAKAGLQQHHVVV